MPREQGWKKPSLALLSPSYEHAPRPQMRTHLARRDSVLKDTNALELGLHSGRSSVASGPFIRTSTKAVAKRSMHAPKYGDWLARLRFRRHPSGTLGHT